MNPQKAGLLAGLGSNAGGMLASAYTGTHGWKGGKLNTGRVLGGLADQALGTGHTFSRGGEALDASKEVISLAPKLGAAGAAAAAYGAYGLGDLAGQAGAHLTGERTMADVDADNRRQLGQGYVSNVGENLVNPGRATIQLGAAWRGMARDAQGAYDSSAKTARMQRAHEFRKAVSRQQEESDRIKRDLQQRGILPQ